MAGLLYFAEGHKHLVTQADIARWNLEYAFESPVECREISRWPLSDRHGVLFVEPSRAAGKPTKPKMEEQTWTQMPEVEGRPSLWVGYWNDAKPAPGDLQRGEIVDGGLVKMADGNFWFVPDVRAYDGVKWISNLPTYLEVDQQGNLVKGRPLDRYLPLWESTTQVADLLESLDDTTDLDLSQQQAVWSAVVALLKANYVVDAPELAFLKVLAANFSMTMAVYTACKREELQNWIEMLKKSENQPEATGSTTSDGNGALPPTTPQPGRTVAHSA